MVAVTPAIATKSIKMANTPLIDVRLGFDNLLGAAGPLLSCIKFTSMSLASH